MRQDRFCLPAFCSKGTILQDYSSHVFEIPPPLTSFYQYRTKYQLRLIQIFLDHKPTRFYWCSKQIALPNISLSIRKMLCEKIIFFLALSLQSAI